MQPCLKSLFSIAASKGVTKNEIENNKYDPSGINPETEGKNESSNQDEKKNSTVSTSTINSCNSPEHSGIFSDKLIDIILLLIL